MPVRDTLTNSHRLRSIAAETHGLFVYLGAPRAIIEDDGASLAWCFLWADSRCAPT
ncbi:hypothetical protein PCAR4_170103 [Paraburkholderia caribensis]|nr:hypothetical protein PCAR4_170103 [Paraburkholderia caribensis]